MRLRTKARLSPPDGRREAVWTGARGGCAGAIRVTFVRDRSTCMPLRRSHWTAGDRLTVEVQQQEEELVQTKGQTSQKRRAEQSCLCEGAVAGRARANHGMALRCGSAVRPVSTSPCRPRRSTSPPNLTSCPFRTAQPARQRGGDIAHSPVVALTICSQYVDG